jgi:transcriptional regulator with XRE-family HTH domain
MKPRGGTALAKLLRQWRERRGTSQSELAARVGISTKHLSFIENARAHPSQPTLLALTSALSLPGPVVDECLELAGYASAPTNADWTERASSEVRAALELVLRHHDPFPAAAYDRDGDVLMLNRTYAAFFVEAWRHLDMPPLPSIVPYTLTEPPRLNLVSTFFDPAGLRSIVDNWEEMARFALARVRRELGRRDPSSAAALVAMVRAYDGVAELWDDVERGGPVPLLQRIHLRFGGSIVRLLVCVTSLECAGDRAVEALRIECFYPADAESDAVIKAFASALPGR